MEPSAGLAQATGNAAGRELELWLAGPRLPGRCLHRPSQALPAEFGQEKECRPQVPESARTLLTMTAEVNSHAFSIPDGKQVQKPHTVLNPWGEERM